MPAKKTTADFIKTVKTTAADRAGQGQVAAADVQAKAKVAYAKGQPVRRSAEFTKGNVDAVVASGKILGAGLQDLGKTYAAEGKMPFETVTTDVKELAEVKSPVEFLRRRATILRRNFDHAIEFNAKTGETMIKLFGEAFAPLSARVAWWSKRSRRPPDPGSAGRHSRRPDRALHGPDGAAPSGPFAFG